MSDGKSDMEVKKDPVGKAFTVSSSQSGSVWHFKSIKEFAKFMSAIESSNILAEDVESKKKSKDSSESESKDSSERDSNALLSLEEV